MNDQGPARDANGNYICFGKHWDANDVQCKGGLDPAYTDSNGTNTRPRCAWFAQCASATVKAKLNKNQSAPVQVPVQTHQPFQSLVRGVTQGAATALVKHITHQAPAVVQRPQMPMPAVPQTQYGYAAPTMVHPSMAGVPYVAPMNYQAPGMQMPAYLSVQEPIVEGQHWMTRLFYNVVRSMMKAGAHTTANFIDHTTINPAYPPQPPTGT